MPTFDGGIQLDGGGAAGLATTAQLTEFLIASSALTADAANFDIQSIPGTYKHLRLFMMLRGTTNAATQTTLLRFNNDSGANYDLQTVNGSAATITAAESFTATSLSILSAAASSASVGAGVFTAYTIDIPFYSSTSFNKVVVYRLGRKIGTASTNLFTSAPAGFWRDSSAINRITITPGADNWATGSAITLHGVT